MTSDTNVVKTVANCLSHAGSKSAISVVIMGELADRMRLILGRKGWSAREWGRRAGLNESHLGRIIRDDDRGKPQERVAYETFVKLAAAAEISVDWLAMGRGTALGVTVKVDENDRYPGRASAVAAARLWLYSDQAISHVLAIDDFEADPGLDHWVNELRAAQTRFSAGAKQPAQKRR